MLSSAGQLIRIPCEQINRIGRATQGVTLMRMKDGETVVTMAVIKPKSEDEDPFANVSVNGKEALS